MTTDQGPYPAQYPVQFAVEYPDRPLNRLTSFFRIFVIIPIAIVLGTVSGATWESAGSNSTLHHSTTYYGPAGAGGLLFFGPLLMILFRQKYPRWWFDWNLELQRFGNRVGTYLALMNDSYPSTDDHQWVELDYAYPDAAADLIASLEPHKSKELLHEMDDREASAVEELMKFGEDSAGGMMTTEMIVVGEDATRGEVVDYIRFHEIGIDQVDNVVLINRDSALAGTVPVGRLLLAEAEQRMVELIFEPLLSVAPDTKDKEVFELFDKYNLRSLTVVDESKHPIGAITVDDVVSRLRAKV